MELMLYIAELLIKYYSNEKDYCAVNAYFGRPCEKEGETKVNELYGTWTVTHLGDGNGGFIALKPSLTSRYSARRCIV